MAPADPLGERARDAVFVQPFNAKRKTAHGARDAPLGNLAAPRQKAGKGTPKREFRVFSIYETRTRFSCAITCLLHSDEWFDRVHEDDIDRLKTMLDAYLNNDTASFAVEYRAKHFNDGYRWMLIRGLAVRDNDGTAYRIAGSQTDITEKKLLELIPNQSNIKKFNHLLRIAVNKKLISISLRPRLTPSNNFQCQLVNFQRVNARVKNLHYKKILSLQKNIDMQKKEILFYSKKNILEGSTTNLIMIKNNQMILPKGNYYKGITMNYFLKKFKNKCIFKSITFSDLMSSDEIVLVGSGKGVVKVSSIPQIKWFSSSSKMFKRLFLIYEAELKL